MNPIKYLLIGFLNIGILVSADTLFAQNEKKVEQYKKAYESLRQEYSLERVAQEKIEVTWENLEGMATPMSNRVAIQERYHRDVVFVQPEMTVALGREDTSLGIGFALDNPLAFPDFHTNVTQKLYQGYLPIVESQWQTENLTVEQTALAVLPFAEEVVTGKEKQYAAIQIRVKNQTAAAQTAVLLVLICSHLDGTAVHLYDQFTAPVSRWQKEPLPVKLLDQSLQWDDKILLTYQCDKSIPAAFHGEYTPKAKTEDQPDRLTNCLQFTLNLAAHETQTIDFVLPGTSSLYPAEERQAMAKISFSSALQRACDHWNNALKPAMKLTVPEERLNLIYKHAILGCLQHVVQNPDLPWRDPLQTLPLTMVWPWEAADMAIPMISAGLHKEYELCMRYFTLRQVRVGPYSADEAPVTDPVFVKLVGVAAPQRPDGDLQSVKGAYIGFNPFWMCDTGSVLSMMAAYYRYTQDNDWLNKNVPSILAAWDFIQNARSQSRIVNDQGEKVDHYGLMPKGRVHDNCGGWGYFYTFTDSITWRGMADMSAAFALANRPEAERMQADAEEYRQNVLAVIDKVQFVDPDTGLLFIPNTVYYRQGPEQRGGLWAADGPIILFSTGLLAASDPRFDAMVEYTRQTSGHLMGLSFSMGGNVWYPHINESVRFMNYLQRGEFEKALLTFYSNLVYGFSHNTFQFVERVDIFNEDFAPLQPNASGNARYISMLRRMVIDEQELGKLWLLRGCPRRWFAPGQEIAVTDAPTLFGKMAVRTKAEGQTITVDIDAPDREVPEAINLVMRHPEKKQWTSVAVNGKEVQVKDELIVLTKPTGHYTVVCK